MGEQYNVLIDGICTLFIGIILYTEYKQNWRGNKLLNERLKKLMVCCLLVLLSDIPGLLLDGQKGHAVTVILWILNSAYWALQIVYCFLWIQLADVWVYRSRTHLKRYRCFYAIPMIAELLLILSNPITGWIFTMNEENVYVRGPYYLINMIPYVLYIFVTLILTCFRNYVDAKQKRRNLLLSFYMFLPVCGLVFDIFVYGISWVWPMVTLSLMFVYLHVQQEISAEEQLQAAAIKSELAENKMKVMLSQIQPHFLFNSLSSITALCEDNKKAQDALINFSRYLRGNIDSLTQTGLLPFETELSHIKNYLYLEKLRFQNKLKVVYDIQTKNFLVPCLTIQPLVENAVKYGVTMSEEGGTVTLSTREEQDAYVIEVKDDGNGFNPLEIQADGRVHIGIKNAKNRLESLCHGTIRIDSSKETGTTILIRIPKNDSSVIQDSFL